jgi:hypothetical protein
MGADAPRCSLAKAKDVGRFRGILAAAYFVVSGPASVDRICRYSCYMTPGNSLFFPTNQGTLPHTRTAETWTSD